MRGPIQWLARPRQRLLVSLDWVDVRRLRCLVLAARLRGRALPLLWAVYRHQELFRSQNNLEYGLLRLLRTMVPRSTHLMQCLAATPRWAERHRPNSASEPRTMPKAAATSSV